MSGDASHITAPSPSGEGAGRCMQKALNSASLNPQDIDYINAHGTSTPLGDIAEISAMKAVFKDHAYKLSVSSTKSATGHLLGAAGAVESIFSVKSLQSGVISPTINLDHPDENADLDLTPLVAKEKKMTYAMSNSFGFGGTNATLIFKKI
jgi:3-oxoacyl-[acyl-carrier-protein] synthase II